MKSKLRIVFLGNHTIGVRTMNVLVSTSALVGVVAHPKDPEDGVVYESVFATAKKLRVPVIRAIGKSPKLKRFILDARPDLLWIADYRYLLPESVIKISRLGAVNLHPSLLPKYRGRAPLNWAIIKGETRLGLTAHWVDAGVDSGDIIVQKAFKLKQTQDVADALKILYPLYQSVTLKVLRAIDAGKFVRFKQEKSEATFFPKRKPEDGLINWNNSARSIWNLVRAVAPPYPGAFAPWKNGKLCVNKIIRTIPFAPRTKPIPGTLMFRGIRKKRIIIACKDQFVEIKNFIFLKN